MSQPSAALTQGPRGWLEILGRRGLAQAGIVALLVTWLYWDQILRMVELWQSHLDWSHGFLILPFSLYIVHSRRDEFARAECRPAWVGLLPLTGGVLLYAAAIYIKIGYPQPLSMLVVIAGAVLLLAGWRALYLCLFPIGFLALGIPPPERVYRQITQPLQQFAAGMAEFVMGVLPGVIVERNGINISVYEEASNRTVAFQVAGACSGMRSLLAFTAIGLAMAYFTPRPFWQRLVMAVLVFPVALACNVIRVVATGAFLTYDWGDLAKGTPHAVLGLCTFGLGLAAYSAILYVMDHWTVDDSSGDEGGAE